MSAAEIDTVASAVQKEGHRRVSLADIEANIASTNTFVAA